MTTSRGRVNALTKKRSPILTVVRCARCYNKIYATNAFKDTTGKHWCPLHEKRGKLLQCAAELGYPAIRFTGDMIRHFSARGLPDYIGPMKYAIGIEGDKDNKELWIINMAHGCDDVINGAARYLGVNDEEATKDEEF